MTNSSQKRLPATTCLCIITTTTVLNANNSMRSSRKSLKNSKVWFKLKEKLKFARIDISKNEIDNIEHTPTCKLFTYFEKNEHQMTTLETTDSIVQFIENSI